jgi:cobalt-zinc-cadmium efflux system protein
MVASNNRTMQRVLKISLGATLVYVLATLYFGLRAHSLALVSEAGHNASDALAIVLSFVAVYFQSRPATDRKTFGYQRAGVLAAFVNALTLIVLSLWIGISAVHRLLTPVIVQPRMMMVVAAAGVLMNGAIAALLWKFAGDVNIRSVFLHMLGDTLSTAAVIVGGAAILFTHLQWIDPVLSLIIAGMILWSSWGIVRETLNILLEGTPKHLALEEIRQSMSAVAGVANVHDLHVWNLGSSSVALASHVTVLCAEGEDVGMIECGAILDGIQNTLWTRFHIAHTTIQFETRGCETTHGCAAPPQVEKLAMHSHHGHSHGHDHGHSHSH